MIGTSKPKVVVEYKDTLVKSSSKFADFENPDFIIMREAVLTFKLIIQDLESKEKD